MDCGRTHAVRLCSALAGKMLLTFLQTFNGADASKLATIKDLAIDLIAQVLVGPFPLFLICSMLSLLWYCRFSRRSIASSTLPFFPWMLSSRYGLMSSVYLGRALIYALQLKSEKIYSLLELFHSGDLAAYNAWYKDNAKLLEQHGMNMYTTSHACFHHP